MADIESLLKETRVFKPDARFSKQANWSRKQIADYRKLGDKDPKRFWAQMAREHVTWFKPWKKALDWKPPFARWFVGAKTNVSYNCLDRHLEGENAWRKNKAAIIWEGEPGDSRVITYAELHREVCRFANVLKGLGVAKGDRVVLYMPMIPEAAVAMLACTRIGAPHSIVFGGFSAEALRDRISDAGAKLVVTADGGYRKGQAFGLKAQVDAAITGESPVEHVVVVRRTGQEVAFEPGRDVWYHDVMKDASAHCAPAKLDSEHPLFILYTSGTTGKPKGIVHTTGGYLVGVYATTKLVFDLKEEDTYWCTADIGWVTGHSYIIYGPLANGATTLMFEGTPDYPGVDRFWDIVEKYGVTIFYTAPTAIRSFMKWGEEHPNKHDLSSLRLLGSVGEPINPEAWMWYYLHIGNSKCPVVDTWWQTETGCILITPLPGITTLKPGSATLPFPGIDVDIVDEKGKSIKEGAGYLVLKKPWPAMLRTIYGDPKRYVDQYWSRFPGMYFTGDGAKRDKDGYFWLLGRVDDVMNVAGHRISTMEVESALVDHPSVAEAAVIGRPDELKGQAIVAFTTLKSKVKSSKDLTDKLRAHVAGKIGAIARPDEIIFTAELPKTRSGKIMRRLLRNIAEGSVIGDTTTLADPVVVQDLKTQYEHLEG